MRKMLESFYVDNLVTGEKNSTNAFHLHETSKQLMAAGGFRLLKWFTSDKALRDRIEQNEEKKKERSESNTTDASDGEETFEKSRSDWDRKLRKVAKRS